MSGAKWPPPARTRVAQDSWPRKSNWTAALESGHLCGRRHLGQVNVGDPPLMTGFLQYRFVIKCNLFCGLWASSRNSTQKSATVLGCDLADFVSLAPDNRPFSEVSNSNHQSGTIPEPLLTPRSSFFKFVFDLCRAPAEVAAAIYRL